MIGHFPDMLGTMIIVQDLPSLRKRFDLCVPDPWRPIAKEGHANSVEIDALRNAHKILGELVGFLDLVPACHVDNALLGANEIDAHPFDSRYPPLPRFDFRGAWGRTGAMAPSEATTKTGGGPVASVANWILLSILTEVIPNASGAQFFE